MGITEVKPIDDCDHQQLVKIEAVEEGHSHDSSLPEGNHKSTEDNSTPFPPTPSPHSITMIRRNKLRKNICAGKKNKLLGSKSKLMVPNRAKKSTSTPEVKSPTLIRAEEFQTSLCSEFPSFVKLMVRSHVSSGYWMGLPVLFCKLYMPNKDAPVILEDESGEQCEVKLIANKAGLSAGWKKFAVRHKLLEGDVLIFHLVGACKFKVYIIRENDVTEVDGALSLLNLEARRKLDETDDAERVKLAPKNKKRRNPTSNSIIAVLKRNKKTGHLHPPSKLAQPVEQSENNSKLAVGLEINLGCGRVSASSRRFEDMKSFEDFKIQVNGMCIDSELPQRIRIKYYSLCCGKKALIHARLLHGLTTALVAGIISETVNIADAIRACKISTSRDEFASWETTLKSFELLGMNVGFLRARLHRLRCLAYESEDASETRRYAEAKAERVRAGAEMRKLEAKVVELKEASEKFDGEIENLKSRAESYELRFQKEVDAPW